MRQNSSIAAPGQNPQARLALGYYPVFRVTSDNLMKHTEIAELLIDIEAQLRQLGQWDKEPPAPEALASEQPFSVDTLTLPQSLQFFCNN